MHCLPHFVKEAILQGRKLFKNNLRNGDTIVVLVAHMFSGKRHLTWSRTGLLMMWSLPAVSFEQDWTSGAMNIAIVVAFMEACPALNAIREHATFALLNHGCLNHWSTC
jgi:hypothetical protein